MILLQAIKTCFRLHHLRSMLYLKSENLYNHNTNSSKAKEKRPLERQHSIVSFTLGSSMLTKENLDQSPEDRGLKLDYQLIQGRDLSSDSIGPCMHGVLRELLVIFSI